jgi:serine/threonine-protein kinase
VHQVIGRGGSSVVYRASNDHSRTLPPIVAIKVAVPESSTQDELRRQFHEQRRVSAAVEHPNVLPVVDSGVDRGLPFLVMPHVAGADLARRLAAHAPTVGRVLTLLRQVAEGLDALHRAGVLHLDVKPSNVLVGHALPPPVAHSGEPQDSGGLPLAAGGRPPAVGGERQPGEHAYVTDLGLGRFLPECGGADRRYQNFVGSPRYAAPEHLRGGAVQPAADVYSLTCVLFACLAGRPPYVGDLPTIVTGHLSARIPSLAALTGLPRRIDRVIGRGMHPDPGSRFGSCRELLLGARLAISGGIG